ncbi:MAG: hypothetical protein JSR82_12420 [Verrucomicrobia bacterium]|nr:hypothetical protein [Verrucomicrobiota bacterium]
MPPASPLSLVVFVLICLGVLAFYVWQARSLAFTLGLALWLGAFAAVVASGWAARQPMPRMMLLFAGVNLVTIAAACSPLGARLATNASITALVALQSFRLPLELVLHDWVGSGTIPPTMTWTGQNWDILSGLAALLLAPLAGRARAAAWLANALGFALLLNVMRVAVLSSPLPFAWGQDPPLLLIFYLPHAFIVPVCVGGALFGHLVLTRALLRPRG